MTSPAPYFERDRCTIYHADCRELLPHLPPTDLVLSDPPYGIGEKWSQGEMNAPNGCSRLWGKGETWDAAPPDDETIRAVIAAGDKAILWGGNYFSVPPSRQWLIWDKMQKFTGSDAELAWTNLDGAVRTFRLSRVEAYSPRTGYSKTHPTEKPTSLMHWCIRQAKDVQTIVDPFMGSGTTLIAARDLGMYCTGIEIEERYCEIAAKRLSQGVLPFGGES